MNTDKNSCWFRAARKRWPGYSVTGDGPWAMVNRSLNSVQLFSFGMFALQALNERTARGDRDCCSLIELVPDYGASINSQKGRPLRRIPGEGQDE